MFAINHAATALIIKKEFPNVPIPWILVSVQLMEVVWTGLNFLGIERTTTEKEVRYVGDVHLSDMPFSHSIVSMVGIALLAWLITSGGSGRSDIGIAVAIGVLSHLVLDLITHDDDIPIAPFMMGPKFGLGLYAKHPIAAFILEIGYGTFCWWFYKGELALLIIIIVFNLANISMFVPGIKGIEKYMANRPVLITSIIFIQILVTLILVGLFS